MKRSLLVTACCLLVSLASMGRGDTLTLAPKSPAGGEYQVEGTIVDYRGDAVVLERPGGGRKTYPAGRVRHLDTDWPATYTAAKRSMANGAWAAAAQELDSAAKQETRIWARRQILVDLMRCKMATGQWRTAGTLLIALDKSDLATPAWGIAPLPWHAADEMRPADAAGWLNDRQNESARLLGASWLLTTQRSEATAELQQLANSRSTPIASLARAQLWRLSLTSVTVSQAEAWRQQIANMPAELRAGPQHVLAQAYYRLARYDAAALAALEAPLTGAASRPLTARGLLLAGQATAKSGYADEARRLWREVRDRYAETPQHADAVSLLNHHQP